MKKITWKLEKRKTADLVPADYNPRQLSDKAKADLAASIDRFGQAEPLVINTNGTLIGGHQRVKVFADLGIAEADVMVPNRKLSTAEEKELNVRLNKNIGEWDWAKMRDFFGLEELQGWGFDADELRVGFGLSAIGDEEVDENRLHVLTVLPPESPKLKDRAVMVFDDIDEYRRVKEAVLSGRIGVEDILGLLR